MQTLLVRYRVTTPVFLGAPAGEGQAELNLRGLKGAARFWWRALNHARLGADVGRLAEAEGRLFGAAVQRGRKYGASRFKWRLRWATEEPKAVAAETVIDKTQPGLGYLAGQGLKGRRCFWTASAPMRLQLDVVAPGKALHDGVAWTAEGQQIADALELLGLVGGIGARKSRAFGSLSLDSLGLRDAPALAIGPCTDGDDYRRRLAAVRARYPEVADFTALPGFPALSERSRIWVLASRGGSALSLMDEVGRQMVRYRSFGVKMGKTRLTVSGEVPEKNFVADHDWAKNPHAAGAPSHPDRIAFGMPLGHNRCDVRFVKPAGRERRGSPLLLHIQHLANGGHLAVAAMLPAKLAPGDGLDVEVKTGDPKNPIAILRRTLAPSFEDMRAWEVLTGFVDGTVGVSGTKLVPQQFYFPDRQQVWP
ncbi:MAG: hypothetical protein KIT25_17015 [Enhydrobacter sp.]|nr:MAG: hypothetical protein KIT25_17015 [Enhydrobacter sp.]